MRGYPDQYFLAAVIVTAANIRKAQRFLAVHENPTDKLYRRGSQAEHRRAGATQAAGQSVDAYAHHLPGEPNLELAADGRERQRNLANQRYQRPGITALVDTEEHTEAAWTTNRQPATGCGLRAEAGIPGGLQSPRRPMNLPTRSTVELTS